MANFFGQNAPSAGSSQNPLPSSGSRTAPPGGGTPNSMTPSVQPTQAVGQGVNGTQDYAAVIREVQQSMPNGTTAQLVAELNKRGIPAMLGSHANGTQPSGDRVVFPNGNYFDVRSDSGWRDPGQPLHWDPSVPVFNAQGQPVNYNEFLTSKGLQPFQFTPGPEDGPQFGGGQGGGQGGGDGLSGYGPLLQPYDKTFTAPTGTDDPGFQFALQKGIDAIQHSAAAKGTLLSGGTLKDLGDYVTGASLQDYAGAYNRAKTTFDTNYNVSRNNKLDPFNMLSSLTGTGLTAAGDANASNTSYGTNQANLATGQGDVNAGRTIGGYNAWANIPANLADLANTYLTRPRQPGIAPPPTANPSVQR